MTASTRIAWADVMRRVPRDRFIPDRVWRHERGRAGNDLVPVDRHTDPDGWAAIVAADEPINVQVDNGSPAPDGTGREVTSSASDRRVVAAMLDALDATPGDRVLEIGTGTGWNAALLAEAGAAVTTIEVDPVLADRARGLLGDRARVVAGDGALGWPPGAPWDGVIATVGTAAVPWAWVAQTRPGGRLVVPLTADWQPPGIAVLTRDGDGATGRLAGPASFMPMRDQARPRPDGAAYDAPVSRTGTTDLHPHHLAGDRAAAVAIGQRVPGVRWAWSDATGSLWLYGDDGVSWASLDTREGPPYAVRQGGPRPLFDEVAAAYRWWVDAGSPGVDRWTVMVDAAATTIRLDGPA